MVYHSSNIFGHCTDLTRKRREEILEQIEVFIEIPETFSFYLPSGAGEPSLDKPLHC
jgi:hypothetical protein